LVEALLQRERSFSAREIDEILGKEEAENGRKLAEGEGKTGYEAEFERSVGPWGGSLRNWDFQLV